MRLNENTHDQDRDCLSCPAEGEEGREEGDGDSGRLSHQPYKMAFLVSASQSKSARTSLSLARSPKPPGTPPINNHHLATSVQLLNTSP